MNSLPKYEAFDECEHCKGTGILEKFIPVQKKTLTVICICRYVSHDVSNQLGGVIGQTARRMRTDI